MMEMLSDLSPNKSVSILLNFGDHALKYISLVYYKDGAWRVAWSMIMFGNFRTECAEVVGNIYENHELLNSEQNAQVSDTTEGDSSAEDGNQIENK